MTWENDRGGGSLNQKQTEENDWEIIKKEWAESRERRDTTNDKAIGPPLGFSFPPAGRLILVSAHNLKYLECWIYWQDVYLPSNQSAPKGKWVLNASEVP